jgi:hypothetical protein
LSFKVAQKKKGEGQVNLMKRGGKLRPEWPKFSSVKVGCGTSGSLVTVFSLGVGKTLLS